MNVKSYGKTAREATKSGDKRKKDAGWGGKGGREEEGERGQEKGRRKGRAAK